jgi:hypothetical protein
MVKFYLDESMSNRVDSIPKVYNSNTEIELRFFKIWNKQDMRYEPSISYEDFHNLESSLNLMKIPFQRENSISEGYDTYRKVIIGNNVIYQTKKQVGGRPVNTLYNDFEIRLSVAEETEIILPDNIQHIKPKIIRKRFRTEYIPNNLYKYVLTRIEGSRKDITYEFEIEFIGIPSIELIEESVSEVLPLLLPLSADIISYLPKTLITHVQKLKKDLFLNNKLKEVKPENLKREETKELYKKGYSVTNKLDGEHFYLIFCEDGIFAVNDRLVERVSTKYSKLYSIADTEYFKGIYYLFDLILYENENLFGQTHANRVGKADVEMKNLPFIKIKYFSQDLFEFSKDFLDNSENIKTNDGLIYTSLDGLKVKKWKYSEKMTLDFLVKFVGIYKGFNVYQLYLGDKENKLKLFEGSKEFPFIHDPVVYTQSKLDENGIYEIGFDFKKGFVLHRQRPDKKNPNYYWTTGVNVWNDINNPFTKEELLILLKDNKFEPTSINVVQDKKVLEEYRKYHNNIKRSLIDVFCVDKKVLDLGAGKGGDLGKYDRVGVKYLWAVEPYKTNYDEFLQRISEDVFANIRKKTKLIKTEAQNTSEILKEMNGETADIVTSFFSLSFSFLITQT